MKEAVRRANSEFMQIFQVAPSVRDFAVRFTILFRGPQLWPAIIKRTASNHAFTVRYKLHLITRIGSRLSIEGDPTQGETMSDAGRGRKKARDEREETPRVTGWRKKAKTSSYKDERP